MASFNPMSQYIQIPFDQKSHFTQFRRFEKYFSSYKIKPSPNEIEQLERECDIPQLYYESYKKTEDYDQILKMVETIYNINDSPIDSLSFFKTLIKLPTFLKGVSRDFFLSQNSYNPRTIHELYNFIVMKKYKITSKQFKFYRLIINKFLRDHSDVMNQIPIEKIFSENSELPLQIILDRINQNIPKIDYNLSMQVKPKDQPEPHLNYDNYDAFDLKILSVKKEKLDREISNRMLNESLLREVNQKSPELSDDEEKKESIHKNLNEKKKIDIDIDEDEEEEVKVSYDKNNKNLIDFNQELEEIEKTGLNFKKLDEKTISFDQTSIEKNSIINNNNNSKEISESLFFNDKKRENNKKEEENFQEIKKDFEELSKTSNLSSLYSISDHFYLVDFQIPPKNLIARKIKSIEICYGKVDLYCDNCTFVSSEAIITKSNISGVKKTKKICRMCSKTFEKAKLPELKSIGLSSKNENIQNKISEKNQNNEFSYELKAFFRMIIVPMKKTNEPISFCQILTQNCYFWENSGNKKLKKKNKQKAIIDRKIGRPHKNNSLNVEDEIDDDRSYTKLFENVTFLITCQCEGLAYEHKGLPLGNRNSFQKQCDKCWNSMHFQIDNIEPKILDPMKYDIDAEKFLKESFC